MLRKFIIIALFAAGLTACKSKGAFNYNQDIVALEKSLEPEIKLTENNVERYVNASQFDSVAIAGEKMEKIVQEKIDKINAMKVPKAKGAEEFKTATLKYFSFIKQMYTGYKKLGQAQTMDERDEIVRDLQELVGEKQSAVSEMQTAQKKYAEENGFKVR
jgi:hypothetical protein